MESLYGQTFIIPAEQTNPFQEMMVYKIHPHPTLPDEKVIVKWGNDQLWDEVAYFKEDVEHYIMTGYWKITGNIQPKKRTFIKSRY
jgi:hypothetical protein